MSQLAKKLSKVPHQITPRRGPLPACDVYGAGDLEDYQAINARHEAGEVWRSIQAAVDAALGIEKPIKHDPFRYHWTGKCAHWDGVDL